MDQWQFEFDWNRVRNYLQKTFDRNSPPDFQEVLFIIGIQELGRIKDEFTKEEKQDLIHIATCELLTRDGFYSFKGRDQDGWPHYEHVRQIPYEGVNAQEQYLKTKIIEYFQTHINETES